MKERIEISSGRVRLRTLLPEDAHLVMEWANDPEVVRNFSFFHSGTSVEKIADYIRVRYESPTDLLLAVFANIDYLGNIGLHEIDRANDTARLGIILGNRNYWGKGYATEAIRVLLGYAFTEERLHKIYLNVFTTNTRGIKLYEKVGFQREGLLRAEYRLDNTYRDLIRYGILAEEFLSASAASSKEFTPPDGWGGRT